MSQFDKLLMRIYKLDRNLRFEELQKYLSIMDIVWALHLAEAVIERSAKPEGRQSRCRVMIL